MHDLNVVENHFARLASLIVIADLEVTLGAVQLSGTHLLLFSTVDLYRKFTTFITQLILKGVANVDMSNLSHLQATHIRNLGDSDGQRARPIVEKLCHRLL